MWYKKLWPRNQKLPSVDFIDRPHVSITVGSPVELKYRKAETDTKRIMTAISALLPPEANEPYEPTPEELAKTYPKGHRPEDVTPS